jgi:S-formylglutathione hydrolase FrmB
MEIFASQCAQQVSTTPVENLPPASTTPLANFATGTTKFAPVSMTPVANNGNNIRLLILEGKKLSMYVNSTTQRRPNKIMKTFLIEELFHLPQVSTSGAP